MLKKQVLWLNYSQRTYELYVKVNVSQKFLKTPNILLNCQCIMCTSIRKIAKRGYIDYWKQSWPLIVVHLYVSRQHVSSCVSSEFVNEELDIDACKYWFPCQEYFRPFGLWKIISVKFHWVFSLLPYFYRRDSMEKYILKLKSTFYV